MATTYDQRGRYRAKAHLFNSATDKCIYCGTFSDEPDATSPCLDAPATADDFDTDDEQAVSNG